LTFYLIIFFILRQCVPGQSLVVNLMTVWGHLVFASLAGTRTATSDSFHFINLHLMVSNCFRHLTSFRLLLPFSSSQPSLYIFAQSFFQTISDLKMAKWHKISLIRCSTNKKKFQIKKKNRGIFGLGESGRVRLEYFRGTALKKWMDGLQKCVFGWIYWIFWLEKPVLLVKLL